MSALNWGIIQDGGTFESLMHAILCAEDPGIDLFGRPGKDAGQDARSANGEVIYQAKYRQQLTMDGAVQIALEELDKIKEYRKPTHPNYRHWQQGRRWVLVANILTNPNDNAEWQTKVRPEFQKEGLEADYWGIKTLEGKLTAHAHVREVFFEGENRILVALKEAHDRLNNECIGSASMKNPFVGREKEMQSIRDFVAADGKRVLPIVGAAGIGKSRLVYESMVVLAQDGWRVLWALPEAMSRSSRWFQLFNSNQRTCVAVDDPADSRLLAAIIEQLAPIERRNWKVVVACRSSQAEMLRPYQKLPLLATPVLLTPLDEAHSKELLISNLQGSFTDAQYHMIFRHTGGVPGWLCLVAELGNRNALRGLPQTVDEIASLYVDDCLSKFEVVNRDKGLRARFKNGRCQS